MNRAILWLVTLPFWASISFGGTVINVLDHGLLPDTPNQVIDIYASGTDSVTGFNLRAQIGNGTAPGAEPLFQSIGFSGGLWDSHPKAVLGGPVSGAWMDAQASVVFSVKGDTVTSNGLIARLNVDTTSIFSGTYALKFAGTEIGQNSDFLGGSGTVLIPTITNGTIKILPSWNGGSASDSNWSIPSNWHGAAPIPSDPLRFASSGTVSTNNWNNFLDGTRFDGITFVGNSTFDLRGNKVKLWGDVVNSSTQPQTVSLALELNGGSRTFNTDTAGMVVQGQISGDSNLAKIGAGRLVLKGANNYGGSTTVSQGILEIANPHALPDSTSLDITGGVVVLNTGLDQAVKVSGLRIGIGRSSASGTNASRLDALMIGSGHPSLGFPTVAVPEPGSIVLLAAAAAFGVIGWWPVRRP